MSIVSTYCENDILPLSIPASLFEMLSSRSGTVTRNFGTSSVEASPKLHFHIWNSWLCIIVHEVFSARCRPPARRRLSTNVSKAVSLNGVMLAILPAKQISHRVSLVLVCSVLKGMVLEWKVERRLGTWNDLSTYIFVDPTSIPGTLANSRSSGLDPRAVVCSRRAKSVVPPPASQTNITSPFSKVFELYLAASTADA